MELDHFRYF